MSDTRVDDKLDRIDTKIDALREDLTDVKVTLSAQHETLKDHTRRSLANEEAVGILAGKLQPIITHVAMVQLAGKIMLTLAGSEIALYILRKVFSA